MLLELACLCGVKEGRKHAYCFLWIDTFHTKSMATSSTAEFYNSCFAVGAAVLSVGSAWHTGAFNSHVLSSSRDGQVVPHSTARLSWTSRSICVPTFFDRPHLTGYLTTRSQFFFADQKIPPTVDW